MAKTKPEDMTEEQRRRSEIQKEARAKKAARRHTHAGEDQTEHDFGDKPHRHDPDGLPVFESEATAPEAEVLPSPTHSTAPAGSEVAYPSMSVTPEVPQGAVAHQHGSTSHVHLEGQRDHKHNDMGHAVFLDKSDEEKEAEHLSALEEARRADAEAKVAIPDIARPENPDIIVTVMDDGFSVGPKTWYRGEEIWLRSDDEQWRDSTGRGFYEMDDAEQIRKYGRVMFRLGPARDFFVQEDPHAEPDLDDLNSRGRSKKQQRTAGPPGRELVESLPASRR